MFCNVLTTAYPDFLFSEIGTEEFFLFILDSCCLQQKSHVQLLVGRRLKAYVK